MRQRFFPYYEHPTPNYPRGRTFRSRTTVYAAAVWIRHVAECDGGWMAFENFDDFRNWKAQK